jgi:hypothetical protein
VRLEVFVALLLLPFNKVMIIAEADEAASSSEGQVKLIPYVWPDTTTTVLIDQFKMITMALADEIANVPREARLEYVIRCVSEKAIPFYFKEYAFSNEVKAKLEGLAKTFKYSHIENGFYGNFFIPCSNAALAAGGYYTRVGLQLVPHI